MFYCGIVPDEKLLHFEHYQEWLNGSMDVSIVDMAIISNILSVSLKVYNNNWKVVFNNIDEHKYECWIQSDGNHYSGVFRG
jgi:hypothetical protein